MAIFLSLFLVLNYGFATDNEDPIATFKTSAGPVSVVASEQLPNESTSETIAHAGMLINSVPSAERTILVVESGSEPSDPVLLGQAKTLGEKTQAKVYHQVAVNSESGNFTKEGALLRFISIFTTYGILTLIAKQSFSTHDLIFTLFSSSVSMFLGISSPLYGKALAKYGLFGLAKPGEKEAPLWMQLAKDAPINFALNYVMNQIAHEVLQDTKVLTIKRLFAVTFTSIISETLSFVATNKMRGVLEKRLSPEEIEKGEVQAITSSTLLVFAVATGIPYFFEMIGSNVVFYGVSVVLITGAGIVSLRTEKLATVSQRFFNWNRRRYNVIQNIQDKSVTACAQAISNIRRVVLSRARAI